MISGTTISKGVHVAGLISRVAGLESTTLLLKSPATREIALALIRVPEVSADSGATLKGPRAYFQTHSALKLYL